MCCNQKYKGKPENFKACKDRPGLVTFENPVFYRGQKTAPPSHNKLQFVYARKHRPFLAGEYHPVDFFLFAAHHNFNSTVGLIMHPAGNSSDFFRPTNGPAPIPNSLNPAVNLYKTSLIILFYFVFKKSSISSSSAFSSRRFSSASSSMPQFSACQSSSKNAAS